MTTDHHPAHYSHLADPLGPGGLLPELGVQQVAGPHLCVQIYFNITTLSTGWPVCHDMKQKAVNQVLWGVFLMF